MVTIDHLSCSYGVRLVLRDFSFSIAKKEALCIKGINGSGKTTLLKILSGLNYCPDLRCRVDGKQLSQNELKEIVTYIPSAPNFYENLSLTEYVAWIKTMWRKNDGFDRSVKKNMKVLALNADQNAEISTYSLGMKYKLYFCVFLALDHPILLLDEPLNSLDLESREASIVLIKEYLKKNNGYCIFSSHVKDTISQLADQVISIEGGNSNE